MTGFHRLAGALFAALAILTGCSGEAPSANGVRAQPPSAASRTALDTRGLPQEATEVIAMIQRGGPFPYRKDGSTFQNRERRLPDQPRGYYREYTVPTPGERTRGARRIVTGGQPPVVYYYTPDHYRTFRKIPEQP